MRDEPQGTSHVSWQPMLRENGQQLGTQDAANLTRVCEEPLINSHNCDGGDSLPQRKKSDAPNVPLPKQSTSTRGDRKQKAVRRQPTALKKQGRLGKALFQTRSLPLPALPPLLSPTSTLGGFSASQRPAAQFAKVDAACCKMRLLDSVLCGHANWQHHLPEGSRAVTFSATSGLSSLGSGTNQQNLPP